MSLVQSEKPSVADYPTSSPYASQIAGAKEKFLALLASDDGWQELGEKQGVVLTKKNVVSLPSSDRSPLGFCPCHMTNRLNGIAG